MRVTVGDGWTRQRRKKREEGDETKKERRPRGERKKKEVSEAALSIELIVQAGKGTTWRPSKPTDSSSFDR